MAFGGVECQFVQRRAMFHEALSDDESSTECDLLVGFFGTYPFNLPGCQLGDDADCASTL